jgi:ADP-ribosylglycohydrolase
VPGLWEDEPLCERIDRVAAGSFKTKRPAEIRGTGYVVDALEAALWAFQGTDSFEAGALAAVNLGDDADTTGAIYGQLAGAYYGLNAIPDRWRGTLALREQIIALADDLLGLSESVHGDMTPPD